MTRKYEVFILVLVAILGLFLRLLFLKDNAITFGYDQARDAYSAIEIVNGHLKIQGPPSSTPGIFHGVLYYYLIAPSYWIGGGSPVATNIWLVVINMLTIIPIYFLGKSLFSSKFGLLASLLFSFSLDAVQYANWMSNPSPAVLFTAIFYLGLGLFAFRKKNLLSILLTALGLGLSIQSEIFLAYLIVPLVVVANVFSLKPTLKQIVLFVTAFGLSVSTMGLSYLKFGFTFLSGIGNLASVGGDPFDAWRQFFPTLGLYLNRFAEYFYRGLMPFNVTVAGAFGFFVIIWAINQIRQKGKYANQLKFLLILLFSHAVLIPFGGTSTPFINVGLQLVVLTLVSVFMVTSFTKHKVWISILFLVMAISSIHSIFKYNPQGQTVFAIQRNLTLKNELQVLDYTYQSSANEHFSINTVTSPLWINTVWSYLYNWYGNSKYGSVPSFHGRDQTGNLGQMQEVSEGDKVYYLILEPAEGIPQQFIDGTIANENTFSKIVEQKNFGGIIVQKRLPIMPFRNIKFIK